MLALCYLRTSYNNASLNKTAETHQNSPVRADRAHITASEGRKGDTGSTFSGSRLRAGVCRVSAHSCPSYASLDFALLTFVLSQSTAKLHLKHSPKSTNFLALMKPNREKTRLWQGACSGACSGAPPAGPPHKPGGGRGRGATSALDGSSVLAYDAANTYRHG